MIVFLYDVVNSIIYPILYSIVLFCILALYTHSDFFNEHLNAICSYYEKIKVKKRTDKDVLYLPKYVQIPQHDISRYENHPVQLTHFENGEVVQNLRLKYENKNLFFIDGKNVICLPLTKSLTVSIFRYKKEPQFNDLFTYKKEVLTPEEIAYNKYKEAKCETLQQKLDYFTHISDEEMSQIKRFKRRKFKQKNSIEIKGIPQTFQYGDTVLLHFDKEELLEFFYYPIKMSVKSVKHQTIIQQHFSSLITKITEKNISDIEARHWSCGINFLLHRLFFQFFDNHKITAKIIEKFQEKVRYSQLPPLVKMMDLTELNFGPKLPLISLPKLIHSDKTGKTIIDFDIEYSDGVQMSIDATLQLPLKSSQTHVKVGLAVKQLKGRLKMMFLQIPSERVWVGCDEDPILNIISEVKFAGKEEKEEKEKKDEKNENSISSVIAYFVKKELIMSSFLNPYMQGFRIPKKTQDKKDKKVPSLENVPNAIEQYRRMKKMFKNAKKEKE
ncbi:hypothetical protein EIN_222360 [Entamoeba invadens IP1]|uniref:SMP-LTD domain-containing protein n=1 Tax=Entamoeba invadens IP1 TaxID=370355 RepID=A0A0A1U801_ENTIV|nr:hypothetical protein EIN_222360 [Entamoeba invadens IP1]ELP88093.1 hypothetical protein EIN_222360 [Entamoeba invadens IP1]|eukprot:XP_004254864.1 hypothetical protein EIN_222360 [Entamoeba invadens IP1]